MTLIYSSNKLGLKGAYRSPKYFKVIEPKATLVYTDSEEIKKAYEDAKIEVEPITEKPRLIKPKAKKETKKETK